MSQTPVTPEEWQEAVDAARFQLLVHAAFVYGLIQTGLEIDVARCQRILALGRQKGFEPNSAVVLYKKFLEVA